LQSQKFFSSDFGSIFYVRKEVYTIEQNPSFVSTNITALGVIALTAWRSGHRFRPRSRRPGFESPPGYKVFREVMFCTIDLTCIVCVVKKRLMQLPSNALSHDVISKNYFSQFLKNDLFVTKRYSILNFLINFEGLYIKIPFKEMSLL
jgi:hypothetical protein